MKGIMVISWNPSSTLGGLYRFAKLLNAIPGRIVRFSGFICITDEYMLHMLATFCMHSIRFLMHRLSLRLKKWLGERGSLTVLFNARTASLCSQICVAAVNSTQRTGTEFFAANSIHLLRTSGSALVLSE